MKHSALINPLANTDAAYTAWGLAIHTGILAAGLVVAPDTGQTNWGSTQPRPTGTTSQTYLHFRMYQFNDTLQATSPYFVKVEFGMNNYNSAASVNNFGMRISIGRATNGAGTLTGDVSSNFFVGPGLNLPAGTTSYPCYFSGSTSSLRMALYHGSPSSPSIFCVGRLRDDDGYETGDGVAIYNMNITAGATSSAIVWHQILPSSSAAAPASPMRPLCGLHPTELNVMGASLGVFASQPFLGYAGPPDLCCVYYTNASHSLQLGSTFEVEIFGVDRTFLLTAGPFTVSGNASPEAVGILWE